MSKSTRTTIETGRSSFVSWFTFVVGVPLGVGALYLVEHGPWQNELVQRYVEHEVEKAEVVLFFCALAMLLAKLLMALRERYVHTQQLLPSWDGKAIPVSEISKLQQSLALVWDSVSGSYLGRRIANILNFVSSRGSADELDDQMRTLSDNDANTLDSSYTLLRFINWSIPILGFLGTVLGITQATAGVTPEKLETGLNEVTGGLANAFDSTALALGFTMVSMFINFLVERYESSLLERVDSYVDAELSHRFVRSQVEGGGTGMIPPALQLLLEKQIAGMERAEQRWAQTHGPGQHEKWAAAMQQALDASLTRFGQRIAETEKKLLERHQAVLDGLASVVVALQETGREHQAAVARLTDAINLSVEMLAKLQSNEAHLLRLQDALNQNLGLLANSATFEQAVESLTAAIHLLSSRVNPSQAATLRAA
ncbi:MAG: MotA/TolQ/ExbB proton channel family protein [Planctomycetes bacterium]|nr:MotA/TolQ/ExbB proton channel family protein [Planctomycetota bacterium]